MKFLKSSTVFQPEYMPKLFLNFNESHPIYFYKRYSYKKRVYYHFNNWSVQSHSNVLGDIFEIKIKKLFCFCYRTLQKIFCRHYLSKVNVHSNNKFVIYVSRVRNKRSRTLNNFGEKTPPKTCLFQPPCLFKFETFFAPTPFNTDAFLKKIIKK